MSKNTDYKIKNVAVSTNGRNEIYFDIEWEGDDTLDCYELRVLDQHRNYLQSAGYAAHNQRVIVRNYDLGLKHKTLRSEVFHIELVAADYVEREEDLKWRLLAGYEPIFVNIYYEYHMFHKNVLEIREPKEDSPRRKSEEYREASRIAQKVVSDAGYCVSIDSEGVYRITSSTIKLISEIARKG